MKLQLLIWHDEGDDERKTNDHDHEIDVRHS